MRLGTRCKRRTPLPDYKATSIVGLRSIFRFLSWHFWQQRWHRAHRKVILMPPHACEKLIWDAREAMAQEGRTDLRLSSDEVITAWICKVVSSLLSLSSKETNLFHRQFIQRNPLRISLSTLPNWFPSTGSRTQLWPITPTTVLFPYPVLSSLSPN